MHPAENIDAIPSTISTHLLKRKEILLEKIKRRKKSKLQKWKSEHSKKIFYTLFPDDMKTIVEEHLCTTDVLMLAIINAYDGYGDCFITTKTLAKMLGKTESTIRDAMCRLRRYGLVHSEQSGGKRYLMATKFDPYRVDDIPSEEELKQKIEMVENEPEKPFSFDELPQDFQDLFEEEEVEEDQLSELF